MVKILLISRDLNYIWALRKSFSKYSIELDFVFTISEANMRLEKINYDLIILDNLREYELQFLQKNKIKNTPLLGVDMENLSFKSFQKENSSFMLSYIKDNFKL
ncbi:MAG: hypothetical protein WHV67_03720 [Thermoanaerobaculia bacterium]